mmetsp:Transcript_81710/g.157782  ORF Transcript_81710/g.157782 Transcript_81710/m.157782 type:complete len:651 (-) Transcript_81710:58-2010(-)
MSKDESNAAAIAAAASSVTLQVCKSIDLEDPLLTLVSDGFKDASLVDTKAGACVSLTKACRRVVESCPADENTQDLDYVLCEVVSAIWDDQCWKGHWGNGAGKASDVSGRCPIRRILSDARSGLSYGDAASNRRYFRNFGRLMTQATMLQDETRTGTYQKAISLNKADFQGKVVMDVGSGTGMLAFFAIQAGAARVYCVEASPMVEVIRELAQRNNCADRIVVVHHVLQDIRDEVPEKVDVITHETLGTFLFAERGIETVLVARDRFLKPGGKLYPAQATFSLAPFEDAAAYKSRMVKAANLWTCTNFHGMDLSSMETRSQLEFFRRPLSDQFHPDILRGDAQTYVYDFRTLNLEEVRNFTLDFTFTAKATCLLHGLAGWFDAHFEGSSCSIILSTSPWDTLTHWWMTRLMMLEPLAVNKGQPVTGSIGFSPCEGNTYQCRLIMECNGVSREINGLDLADIDTASRAQQNKIVQITPTKKVGMIDWEATRAAPSGDEVLVSDPLREAKTAAMVSEASVRAATSTATSSMAAAGTCEYGAQIRMNDGLYMHVDDPELLSWAVRQPQAFHFPVASLNGTTLMRPKDDARGYVLQTSGANAAPRIWMQLELALKLMREFVQHHSNPPALQVDKLDQESLVRTYVAMKRAAAGD